MIERSFALGDDPSHVTPEDLPPEIREGGGIKGGGLTGFQAAAQEVEQGFSLAARIGSLSEEFPTYDQLVAEHIRLALLKTRGVKSRAANLLSIDRNRLYRLMHKYQIVPDGS